MRKFIVIMNENVTYSVKDKEDCIKIILEEYEKFDLSMFDLLSGIEVQGFSIEDVVSIYATCMNKTDGDYIIHVRDIEEKDYTKHEFLGDVM